MLKPLLGGLLALSLSANLQIAQAACTVPLTVTYSFSAGTTAVAAEVNQNFSDLTNCALPATGGTLTGGTLAGITTLPGSGQISSTGWLGIGGTPAAQVHFLGNVSAPAWGANGIGLRGGNGTYTDTTSTGTVTAATVHGFQIPTLAASNPTTYTTASTLRISGDPNAGTNVTITNPLALFVASGNVSLGANLLIGAAANVIPSARIHVGNQPLSQAAWTTSGIALSIRSATYTDTSSSGTVSDIAGSGIGVPTIAASNTTTYTTASTLRINGAPAAGSNVTITTPLSLYIAAGNASVAANSGFGTTSPATKVDVNGTFRVMQATPPSNAACSPGQIVGDANYLYTCSISGAWKRVAVTGGY